jgi:hypothetical protein
VSLVRVKGLTVIEVKDAEKRGNYNERQQRGSVYKL